VRRLATVLTLFALAAPAHAAVFVVHGHGWGHGVGMSQWGARGLARHGWGWQRILAHYYPGTRLARADHMRIRVLVAERRNRIAISSRSPFRILDGRGRSRLQRRRIVFRGRHWHGLRPPLRIVPGVEPLVLDGAGFRGELVVRRGINVVNDLPLERYLRGVVPWEMPSHWNADALRAQAVAARTYALATRNPGWTFDLYDDTRDQMYGGIRAEKRSTNLAVGATAGRILTWGGEPARTYYFSTSGGRTESSHDAFRTGAIPYLQSVPDPYDAGPHHDWTFRFTTRQLTRKLGVPGIASIAVRLNGSGRAAAVVVREKRGGRRTIDGNAFRSALGLPSTWFSFGPRGAPHASNVRGNRPQVGWVAVLSSSTTRTAGTVRSDSLPGLRPGFWVRIAGPYASRARAQAVASRRGGYVRRVHP
jgi:stage II sporulation protein D